MTSLMLEHLGDPSSAQDMRQRERARSEAIDGPLRDLTRRLDAMLSGHGRGQRP